MATINAGAARALRLQASGKDSTILVRPGTYRESITFHGPSSGNSNLGSITLKGIGKKPVVISGSDVWNSGWSAGPESGWYQHDWPYNWGESDLPAGWNPDADVPDIIRRREMIFVNGKHLTQYMAQSDLKYNKNSFHVDESANKVYIRPPDGTDISNANIEVAIRDRLFSANDQRNVTIRNITFQHATSGVESMAFFFRDSANIKIIRSRFLWNNWGGFTIAASNDVLVKRTEANHNGVYGFTAGGSQNLRFLRTETSFNNWRGSREWDLNNHSSAVRNHFIDFASGQKFFFLRDVTFSRHRSIGNLTGGLWFDTDNARITLNRVVLNRNLTHGLFVEANQGPFTIKNSVMCNNETGVLMQHSTNGRLLNSTVQNNILGQFMVIGVEDPRHVKDTETGEDYYLHARNWTVRNNIFGAGPDSFNLRTYLEREQWDIYENSLTQDDNTWRYAEGRPRVFRVPGGPNQNMTFGEWRQKSGHDKNSKATTSGRQCARPKAKKGTNGAPTEPSPSPAPSATPSPSPGTSPNPAPTASPSPTPVITLPPPPALALGVALGVISAT